jgi:hypothetical protein
MPGAAGAATAIRDRVAAVNFVLACLALAADLGAVVVVMLAPLALDWLQPLVPHGEHVRDVRDVAFALVLVAGGGGVLSLLIGATVRSTAGARGVATLAVVSTMAFLIVDPGMIRYCCGGNEASAIGALRAINSAESAYSSSCAAGGYATDLADLAKSPPGWRSHGFIRPDLRSNGVIWSGYIIALTKNAASGVTDVGSLAATCNGSTSQPASSYFASAVPVAVGSTGQRSFATDSRGTIYFVNSGVAIANPIPAAASFLQ